MIEYIAFIILGLGILVIAGDLLVRGAVSLANILKVPPLLIGLTIIAFGTSAPEFVVTLQDVLTGEAGENGIAMGNIIGSNIANILLVLGLPAIITPIAMKMPGLRRHATVMLMATALFMFFAYYRGAIDTLAGIVLISGIVAYVIYVGYRAMTGHGSEEPVLDDLEEYTEDNGEKWKTPVFLIAGLIGLPLGAKLLVDNGSAMALDLGVRPELIGLTIVAFGTSLPELATVFAAAMKRQADVAVGNIVGSNIFNLLFVGGTAGLAGFSTFTVDARLIDMPVMLVSTLILAVMIYAHAKLTRVLGGVFLLLYLSYIVFLGLNASIL